MKSSTLFLAALWTVSLPTGAVLCQGQEPPQASQSAEAKQSLERFLEQLRASLLVVQRDVRDYTAKMVKRERQKLRLGDQEIMFIKIRNRRTDAQGRVITPFSVYLKNLEPKSVAGREAIYVEQRSGNKIVAHETGFTNLFRVHLDPNGSIAMQGRRHPITEIGLENLLLQLIARIEAEAKKRQYEIAFIAGEQVEGRSCLLIEWKILVQQSPDEVQMLRIYFDDELKVPLRFALYLWPEKPGGEPRLDEEFTYRDLKLNVGLTEVDFDPNNPAYNYP